MSQAGLPRRWPLAAALGAAILLAACVFSSIQVRSDLADLLPPGGTQAGRLMVEQLRSGPASSLLLIGIEGAAEADLASVSNRLADMLRESGRFSFVDNGRFQLSPAAMNLLFQYRYRLAPDLSPDQFTETALHADFASLVDALQSSASPVVEQYGLPDPTGAFRAMASSLAGDSQVRSRDGVWFSPHRPRALMLAKTTANGLDFTQEDASIALLRRSFAAARAAVPGAASATMLVSGPALFAHDAAAAITRDVRLLTMLSGVLVTGLLVWRFRSVWVVGAIFIPLLASAAAGALAVQLVFGFVHGITLGFGMTMLGVTVDYPVLLVGHRKQGEAPRFTIRRIGHAFALAVMTAALGLSGMVFARFPGLSQLGVFSVAGILTAAAVTRLGLPRLIAAAGLAPVSAGNPAGLARLEAARRWRLVPLGAAGTAAIALAIAGGPKWDPDLAHLSPVPPSALALDAELRAELGAPETGQVLVVQGSSADDVLEREENLAAALKDLAKTGAIAGADDAAQLLPSQRTQRARNAMLPDPATLAARVQAASQGLGFTEAAFKPFLDGVAASPALPPLDPARLPAPLAANALLRARLGALLFQRGPDWFGIIAPRGVTDPARLAAVVAGHDGVTYIDVHAETNAIAAGYTRQAGPWLLGGVLAAAIVLAAGLRDTGRLLRVAGSIGAALLLTLALLTLAGIELTLVHLMALQFVAGIGLDYALFFSRTGLDEEERMRTLRTLFTCNAMALLTFGLLCICRTPLLRDIGETVSIGVVAAMGFAFMIAGPRTQAEAWHRST